MTYDLLSIGDATIDTFLFINDAHVSCSIKRENCQLCVNYADKLPVEKLVRTVAGNASNNAVGSARLGLKTALVCTVGNDGSGQWIRHELKEEGVDTKFVKLDLKSESNASTVLSFQGERTIFVYHAPRNYVLPVKLPGAKAVYYTSVGEKHEKLNRDVIAYVKKTGARLGFNPGTYQMRAGLVLMKPLLRQVDTIFINKEEAERILGHDGDIKQCMREFYALGCKVVVITDGSEGSYAFDGASDKFYFMGTPNTPVVERTGAGDSFASAFFAARNAGKSVPDAMCEGTMNASSVIMHIGPHAGLLSASQIAKFHKKYKHTCAKVL